MDSNVFDKTSNAWNYITTTPVHSDYTDFRVWHLLAFLILGPMLTWPMLVLLLLIMFSNQTINLFKGIRSSNTNNG